LEKILLGIIISIQDWVKNVRVCMRPQHLVKPV